MAEEKTNKALDDITGIVDNMGKIVTNANTIFAQLAESLSKTGVSFDTLSSDMEMCIRDRDKVEGADKGTFNNVPWDEGQIRPAALAYFRKMVRFCKEEGIELEVITLPVPADTIANMPDSFRQSDAYFKALTKKYQVPYKNFNFDDGLNIDRSMEGYWDYDGHMYGEEAERFSAELGKYLSENETKKEN